MGASSDPTAVKPTNKAGSATEVDDDASPHYGPITGRVTPAHRRVQAPAASNVATSNILFLAWIVRRIDIGDRKRPFAVNLNDGFGCGPGVMIHLGWRFSKASRPK
jgi:hypothetical protein